MESIEVNGPITLKTDFCSRSAQRVAGAAFSTFVQGIIVLLLLGAHGGERDAGQAEILLTSIREAQATRTAPPDLPRFSVPLADTDVVRPNAPEDLLRQSLPPRPDPRRLNPSPSLPQSFSGASWAGRRLVVVLRILVLESGTIGDATVEGSSGYGTLDEVARKFVLSSWQFLPAVSAGKPVRQWTTVEVQFAEAVPQE